MKKEPEIEFNLSEVLKKKGVTPYRLAKETGISKTTIYNLKNNFRNSTTSILIPICNYLEIQLSDLITIKKFTNGTN